MTDSVLDLLKQDKCYCLRRQKVISLLDCDVVNCHREKGCRKSTNNKVDKELKNVRKFKKL